MRSYKTPKTVVKYAVQLLEDKDNWTTKVNARDILGAPVDPYGDDACKWCASGALLRFAADAGTWASTYRLIKDANGFERGFDPEGRLLSEVNDDLGYEAVMAVLRKALD